MEYTVNYGKDLKRELKTDDLEKALRVCKNCFTRCDVVHSFGIGTIEDGYEAIRYIELPENMEQLKAEIEKVTADAPKINKGKRKEQSDSDLPDL